MNARETLHAWVEIGDPAEVIRRARALAPDERRAVAAELPRYLRDRRDSAEFRWLGPDVTTSLLVAGAATIGGAAGVAAWVWRAELRSAGGVVGRDRDLGTLVRQAVADRPNAWRSDLARRVAARLRVNGERWIEYRYWLLAADLVRELGEEPPTDDAFVLIWAENSPARTPLEHDPFLDTLLPRLFEVDGLGSGLSCHGTLVTLARDGRIKREALLDGCVARFLRGGRAADLRWFVQLYESLEPVVDEAAARLRDLVRLLPAAPTPVAELALREIRRVDETEPLAGDVFAEVADAVLFRPEKKLVRAALIWLDRTARKRDRVDATLRAITVLLGADDLDLRERAEKIAAKHAAKATADTRAALSVEPPTTSAPLPGPPPFTPREHPGPIASPAELAEEISASMRVTPDEALSALDRLLAGLVECAYRDAEGTRTALARVLPEAANEASAPDAAEVATWLTRIAARFADSEAPGGLRVLLGKFQRKPAWYAQSYRPLPERFLAWRMREIPAAAGRSPVLLATPTTASGHLDADVLVARMRRLEDAGLAPLPSDLCQAMLRVPRDIGAGTVAASARLASDAGRALASWLAAGGLPDPGVTCANVTLPGPYPPFEASSRMLATVTTEADLPGDIAALLRLPWTGTWQSLPKGYHRGGVSVWPTLLPSHREVAAAHMLPYLPEWSQYWRESGTVLLALAEADGPAGAATATVLAYGLNAQTKSERAGSVDAVLAFSGRGQLPARELGDAIATLYRQGGLKINRVAEALDESARAGAYTDVWTILATALPRLLPVRGERAAAGLPDLLAVATRAAEALGARENLAGLSDVAGRGGTSRLVREAARLHRALARER
ncbi:DUF6493 family protein [Actinomadura rudentiformis]|uniref:DUF6493 domain-containing protein n=1 Tax=Actinomadura rudentiformis TaxID=359158 RepID=A0A6H9YWK7_9ACTN|nr:DUF6493 family protein [Actinomadura rudentiformis]KAB2345258.1 hypothetical protein F8566_28790 [Actinomadura rudentiformis]